MKFKLQVQKVSLKKFFTKACLFNFMLLFLISSSIFWLVNLLMKNKCIFGTFEGSSNYHCLFPYQYIVIASISYAIIISIWTFYFYEADRKQKHLSLLIAFGIIIFLSSILGGVLWAVHEMLEEPLLRGMGTFQFFIFQIKRSIIYGWLAIAKSFPFNLVMLVIGLVITNFIAKWSISFSGK